MDRAHVGSVGDDGGFGLRKDGFLRSAIKISGWLAGWFGWLKLTMMTGGFRDERARCVLRRLRSGRKGWRGN